VKSLEETGRGRKFKRRGGGGGSIELNKKGVKRKRKKLADLDMVGDLKKIF